MKPCASTSMKASPSQLLFLRAAGGLIVIFHEYGFARRPWQPSQWPGGSNALKHSKPATQHAESTAAAQPTASDQHTRPQSQHEGMEQVERSPGVLEPVESRLGKVQVQGRPREETRAQTFAVVLLNWGGSCPNAPIHHCPSCGSCCLRASYSSYLHAYHGASVQARGKTKLSSLAEWSAEVCGLREFYVRLQPPVGNLGHFHPQAHPPWQLP